MAAILAVAAAFLVISDRLMVGPRWLPLAAAVALVAPSVAATLRGRHGVARGLALALLALLTAAVTVSVFFLVTTLPRGTTEPRVLLIDAALIWLVNLVVFALWYYEVDSDGPTSRHLRGHRAVDFVFPQVELPEPPDPPWCPDLVDYLFLAFNTSTAFSPTDTLVLSRRAKLLMMAQSLLSLLIIAFLAARAINTL